MEKNSENKINLSTVWKWFKAKIILISQKYLWWDYSKWWKKRMLQA